MFLSVIIPAYNEEKRLPETLKKVREYLTRQSFNWEILIVNDGSSDKTAQVVRDLIKDWLKFRLLDNKQNRGKGAVVKQGMLEAKGDWRLFMDADNSTDISEIEKLFNYARPCHIKDTGPTPAPASRRGLRSRPKTPPGGRDHAFWPARVTLSGNGLAEYDIIIGSRYLKAGSIKIKQPLSRRIVSRIGNFLVRILLGLDMVDTQCGFKLFSHKSAEKIFPLQTIDRWGFDMEILTIGVKKGYKIKEVPVNWADAEGSQVKKSAALKTFKEILLIRRNLKKGIYK